MRRAAEERLCEDNVGGLAERTHDAEEVIAAIMGSTAILCVCARGCARLRRTCGDWGEGETRNKKMDKTTKS